MTYRHKMLPGLLSKPWAKVLFGKTSFSVLEVEHMYTDGLRGLGYIAVPAKWGQLSCTDGLIVSGFTGTCSQQDFPPLASCRNLLLDLLPKLKSTNHLRTCSGPDAIFVLPAGRSVTVGPDLQPDELKAGLAGHC